MEYKFNNREIKVEKIDKIFIKFDLAWNKLVKEAGSIEELSKGAKLNRDNFANFIDITFNLVHIIRTDLERAFDHDEQDHNLSPRKTYLPYIEKLKNIVDSITDINGVSAINLSQLDSIKRNIDYLI